MREYEDKDRSLKLTDDLEVRFIELPVFNKIQKDFADPLHRWLVFMKQDISGPQLKELMEMDKAICRTEERLEYFSGNDEIRQLYEAREFAKYELNGMRRASREQGMEEGLKEGIKEGVKAANLASARRMLDRNLDIPMIAEITGLTEEEIGSLKNGSQEG
ncbi:Rpn family recombination-promoting nuclease/putative transposase [Saccharibacillus sp. CPCC 101409]|uniref:Rpn family recombination-promoting nuclease/putative transposase n=1 Tax=Saccharibacillus sp. CPCC 101409 TaxID=3058041 RepID=UPI0026731738|nr:Rpn family recombination-promoting nuclease/putative transposase [Saccharibacillus sp. CPCC 101409]MDO3412067.1 Rpn family recombination-promoting nuclease/putative transposase [Saccharibacillus sp. CPCC 101409]